MKVIDKRDNEKYEVYDIVYNNKTGYPRFLIYKDEQWLRVSAKYFAPFDALEELDKALDECWRRYIKE